MLQVLLEINDRYSLSEMAQMAIEAGCGWIVLGPDMPEAEKREHYPAIVEMCRESGTMLTVTADIEAAKEYGLHGVFLPLGSVSPLKVREELGAEAIIGAEVGESSVALELERADIDYVSLKSDGKAAAAIAEIRAAGSDFPVVAYAGDASLEAAAALKEAGFSGICCGKALFEATDPIECMTRLREFLMKS